MVIKEHPEGACWWCIPILEEPGDSPCEEETPVVKTGSDLGAPRSVTAPLSRAITHGLPKGPVSGFENLAFRNPSTFTRYLGRLVNSLQFSFKRSSTDALLMAAPL